MVRWPREHGMWLLMGALVLLLGLLAVLQYRWTGEIGRAEAERERARLERSAQRFSRALGRDIGRVMLAFHPEMRPGANVDPRLRYLNRFDAWRRTEHADLVSRVVLVLRSGSNGLVAEACDAEGHEFSPIPLPRRLERMKEQLAQMGDARAIRGGFRPDWLLGDPFALTVPIIQRASDGATRTGPPGFRFGGFVVVELSHDYLRGELLPELAEVHFGPLEEGDYAVAVLDQPDGAVFYSSDPALGADEWSRAEMRMDLLLPPMTGLGSPRDRFDRGGRFGDVRPMGRPRRPVRWAEGGPDEGPSRPHLNRRGVSEPRPVGKGPWVLAVRHHGGSLAEAVDAVRRRNFAVGLGILALLGTAAALLAIGGQRARQLARQQLDFVAGVTHELHTPLAAIRSAGQNLADGVVSDARQVQRYGDLIQKEGGRLTALVAQVLDFAGIESGVRSYAKGSVAIGSVVRKATEDLSLVLEQAGLQLEVDVAEDLPQIRGDEAALRRALENVLTNAAKFAAVGGWVGVRAARSADGRMIVVRVEDRGPGIPKSERGRVFEPFARGRNAHETQASGSGLGLSLVRHVAEVHGGHVRLESRDEGGTAVVMELPITAGPEEEA